MNHNAQAALISYMSDPIKDLTDSQLASYRWLVEHMLAEILRAIKERPQSIILNS